MGLVGLDPREVCSFTFRESVLAVKLEFGSDNRVLAPAMHVKRRFRKHEGSGIRDTRVFKRFFNITKVGLVVGVGRTVPVTSEAGIRGVVKGTSVLEKTMGIDVSTGISGNSRRTTEGMDGVRKSINGISVVERLSTKDLEQKSIASQR